MPGRMPRLVFYKILVALLIGFVVGLIELVYQLVADEEPGPLGPRWDYQQKYRWQ